MKFLFDDESFSFETLRTTGFAAMAGPTSARSSPQPATSRGVTRPAALYRIIDRGGPRRHRDHCADNAHRRHTQVRWGLRNGMWVFGADSIADLIPRCEVVIRH
jgi:hypothetical protein